MSEFLFNLLKDPTPEKALMCSEGTGMTGNANPALLNHCGEKFRLCGGECPEQEEDTGGVVFCDISDHVIGKGGPKLHMGSRSALFDAKGGV